MELHYNNTLITKTSLNFGSHQRLDRICGNFNASSWQTGHFPQFGSYPWENTDRIFAKIFIKDVSLDKEVPLNFRSHPDLSSLVLIIYFYYGFVNGWSGWPSG